MSHACNTNFKSYIKHVGLYWTYWNMLDYIGVHLTYWTYWNILVYDGP